MHRLRPLNACLLLLTLTTNIFVALPAAAIPGWTVTGEASLGRDVVALAASPARFVALTDTSGVLWSDDGLAWQRPTAMPPSHHLAALAFGNGAFVAVGNGALRSTDAQSWSYARVARSSFTALGFNGARFIAAGASAPTVMTSTDGVSWTAAAGAPTTLGSAAFVTIGNGIALVYGTGSTLLRSADGVTWQTLTVPVVGGRAFWDGAQFVFGVTGGQHFGSPDGITWTLLVGYSTEVPQATAVLGSASFYLYPDRVDHGGGAANPGGGVTATAPELLRAIAATANAVVAAGEVGAWYRYQDLAGWTALGGATAANGDEGPVTSVELGGQLLAWTQGHAAPGGTLVGRGQTHFTPGHLMRSADGSAWDSPAVNAPPAPGADLGEMAVFGGLIYTVSADRLYSSSDGLSWTEVEQFPWPLATVATDGTTLVVSGANTGQLGIASSTDVSTWNTFTFTISNVNALDLMPTRIVHTHMGWMAFCSGGGVWTSADAVNWTHTAPLTIANVGSVSSGNNRVWFVQRGSGITRWTINNVEWILAPFHLRFLTAPRWDGTRWLGIARDVVSIPSGSEHLAAVYESADGDVWHIVRESEFFDPRHIHVGAEGSFVLGAGGTALRLDSHPALVAQVAHEVTLTPAITASRNESLATLSGATPGALFHIIYDGGSLGSVTLDQTTGALTLTNTGGVIGNGFFDYYAEYAGGRQSNRGRISYSMSVDAGSAPVGGGGGASDPLLALALGLWALRRARRG
jgi:hypothetical protein